jgi:pilus assembly protein Flp/PilA
MNVLLPAEEGPAFSQGGSTMFTKFFRDETGLELSEYAVAAALVAVATVMAYQLLGSSIGTKIEGLAGFINNGV